MSLLSSLELSTRIESQKDVVRVASIGDTVLLQPIILRFSNKHNVYSISKLKPQKLLSEKEFLSKYADYPRLVSVCFDEEVLSDEMMFQKSELITAYNFGLGCWYIVIPHKISN